MENIYSPGIHTCNQNINSYIEFKTIDQKRVVNVLADNAGLIDWDFGNIVNDENTFSLR